MPLGLIERKNEKKNGRFEKKAEGARTLKWCARVTLLRLSGEFYPDLIYELYANMLHKMDKDLETIISTVKGVRIILTRKRLTSILGSKKKRASIDHREVMLARLRSRFMPGQDSSKGGGADFDPQ
ncbi:hypothetical protein M9H77_07943 [Catharanthus roseus]|uniref:Uncharacterized protein n=1 Tax=Catharanthus roseus TaxID=4058 RepID=A0ACC0BWT2_CATRO|nr:hypothetical protein M9H77_07943 [Catharanthus roseus]